MRGLRLFCIVGLWPTLAGVASATDVTRVLATDAAQPHMAIAADGTIYVVFIHKGDIAVSISTNRGASFADPVIAIDAGGKARGGMHRGPRVGVDARQQVTVTCPVVLDEDEHRKKYPTAELVLATSRDGGRTWSKPAQVNEVAKKAPEALHWMKVAPSGEVHIAWLDMRNRTEPGQDLFYARCVDGKIGKNQQIASLVCECCAPGMALDAAGNPTIAYREGGYEPSREIFAVRSMDKGEHFDKPMRINPTPTKEKGCPMSAPAVVVSADGSQVAAAWKNVSTGRPQVQWALSKAFPFASDAPVRASGNGRQDHPSMTMDPSGAVWLVWEEKVDGNQRVWARTSAASDPGRVLSDLSEGQAGFPVIDTNAGLIAVAYEARNDGKSSIVFRLLPPL